MTTETTEMRRAMQCGFCPGFASANEPWAEVLILSHAAIAHPAETERFDRYLAAIRVPEAERDSVRIDYIVNPGKYNQNIAIAEYLGVLRP